MTEHHIAKDINYNYPIEKKTVSVFAVKNSLYGTWKYLDLSNFPQYHIE